MGSVSADNRRAAVRVRSAATTDRCVIRPNWPGDAKCIGQQAEGERRCLESGGRHFRFRDLEMVSTGTSAPMEFGSAVSGANVQFSGCIYSAQALTGTTTALLMSTASITAATIENCVFISSTRCADTRNIGALAIRNSTFWSTTDQLVVIAGPTTSAQPTRTKAKAGNIRKNRAIANCSRLFFSNKLLVTTRPLKKKNTLTAKEPL